MNPSTTNPGGMNPKLVRLLVRLYPRAWRERYGAEFAAVLETGRGGPGASANVIWSALGERIFPTVGGNMEQSRFQSWCVRAPWAMFGLGLSFFSPRPTSSPASFCGRGGRCFCPEQRHPSSLSTGLQSFISKLAGCSFQRADSHRMGHGMGRRSPTIESALARSRLDINRLHRWLDQVYTSPPVGLGGAGHVRIGFPVDLRVCRSRTACFMPW